MHEREYLFDLQNDIEESKNLIDEHPEIASQLFGDLETWSRDLSPPGLDASKSEGMSRQGHIYFDWYLDGIRTTSAPPESKPKRTGNKRQPKNDPVSIFASRDDDENGKVTWEEFLNQRTGDTVPIIRRNFERYDLDSNGIWETDELPK